MNITGSQVRAARGFLNWTVARLAEAADVGLSTVQAIEKHDGLPTVSPELRWRAEARAEALAKIQSAFEAAGITFLAANAQGIGLRGKIVNP